MPRTKSTAKRGNQASSRGGRRGPNNQSSFQPFEGASSSRRGHNDFTLEDEARNTERHHDFWNSDKKLRHAKVNFISAGTLEPSEPKDTMSAMAKMTLESPEPEDNEVLNGSEEEHVEKLATNELILLEMLHAYEESGGFVVDTHGSAPVRTGLPPPVIRSSSPTPSSSSEEVILFRGRHREEPAISGASSNHRVLVPAEAIDMKIRVVEDRIHKLEEVLHQPTSSGPAIPASSEKSSQFAINKNSRRNRKKKRENKNLQTAEEDAIIADYLANVDEEEEEEEEEEEDAAALLKTFGQRELGGDLGEVDSWQETGESSSDALKISKILNSKWTHSDINDFDDLSTSDGVLGEVQAILSKRDRASGLQYLVVWQNHTVDEARWVPSTTLNSESALAQIAAFETEETLVHQYVDNGEEETSDSTDINLGDDIIEVEEEEDDDNDANSDKKRTSHMSDEQIARLLAKQEELGMGSTELLLFDNEADADEEDYTPLKFNPIMTPSKGKGKGSQRPRGEFPSATRMADAYDGFDVMDFERPSLKRKPKGRKGKLVFDLSDSELEAEMQMSWENNRLKKKERKEEREELRTQGLLGRKNSKSDMNSRYKEGMGIHAVKEEIKKFLMGDNATLALPPMEKADRKVVHELANAFNLKSKSAGNGNRRFPILYRTERTSYFTENAFNTVEARISRRFLPRMDAKRSGGGVKRAGTGGGFNKAAVSYRDGDIVGGSAPELGVENKGRAMLEKMGWSSGTALGALNNKGILQPVSHVVKTTKAGLG